jgi:tight adherence protein B
VTPIVLGLTAGSGVFLLYTSIVLGWRGLRRGDRARRSPTARISPWLAQAGLASVRPAEIAGVGSALLAAGAAVGWATFGGVAAAAGAGLVFVAGPAGAMRARRERALARAHEAWPGIIEEIRVRTSAAGRPLPQALFEAAASAPHELRPAFDAAPREWLLTTDFSRTIVVLKANVADATADAVGETLLVAHEVGGTDVDRRLSALAEDRILEIQGRKDAAAKQAGVRFARRFVLVVPVGMAGVGLTIGNGRAAYQTPTGQAAALVAVALLAACWLWSGRMLRVPHPERVFA